MSLMNEMRSRSFAGRGQDGSPLVRAKRPSGASSDKGIGSVAVPRTAARTSDSRDADRHRLPGETISVMHKRRRRKVQLINLSGGGAMLSASGWSPKLWDRVELHLGEDNGMIEAVVRWIKDDRIGLEFAHETRIDCSPMELNEILREVISKSFPDVAIPAVRVPEPVKAEVETPPAQSAEPEDEHREGGRRHPLIWSGQVHYDHESTRVRVRNISATGALIECERTLPVGAEPLLDLGEAGTMFATVAWAVGDQIGLAFKDPFNLGHLGRAKPEVAPVRCVRPDYAGEGAAPASPWEKHWQRMTLSEISDELEGFLKR